MRDLINNYIFEGDRLKIMAKNYLQEHHLSNSDLVVIWVHR